MAAGYELGVLGVQCSATELYQGSVRPTACVFILEESAGGICLSKNVKNMSNVIMLSCI